MAEPQSSSENNRVQLEKEGKAAFSLGRFVIVGFAGAGIALVISIIIALILGFVFDVDNMAVRLVVFAPAGFAISGGSYLTGLKKAGVITAKNIVLAAIIAAVIGLLAGLIGQDAVHPNARDMWPLISMLGVPVIMGLQLFSDDSKPRTKK
ncbi:MAG: hypothetical protein PHO00_07630 [bacterium]|nr:hypothetical protein [bacterium]